MTRQTLTILVAASVVLTTIAGVGVPGIGLAAAADGTDSDGPTGVAQSGSTILSPTSYDVPEEAKTYGAGGYPGWIVTISDGKMDSVREWTNQSSERTIIDEQNATNRVLVSAPADEMGVTWLDRNVAGIEGLAQAGYVESVDLNLQVSYAEPMEYDSDRRLENASGVDSPELPTRAKYNPWSDADYSTDGIAFSEDATAGPLAESRNVTGSDRVAGTGEGVIVSVIDSGASTADGRNFGNGTAGSESRIMNASKDFIDNETVGEAGLDAVEDPNGHGTHVASTIAANTSNPSLDGYAPDADLLILRALDEDGSGNTYDIAQAVRYAADQNADIISMSLGSPVYSAELADAIAYAFDQNVTAVVVAAGNSRQTARWVASPGDTPQKGVITVTASNTTDYQNASVGYFGQLGHDPGTTDTSLGETTGQQIDVTAPGMKITAQTATTSGTTMNETLTGTSMAAPQVSGALAQVLDEHPDWKGDRTGMHDRLADSSRPMQHAAVAEAGNGMLAVDHLNESWSPDSQESQMTDEAYAREQTWRSLSTAAGSWVSSLPTFPLVEVAA